MLLLLLTSLFYSSWIVWWRWWILSQSLLWQKTEILWLDNELIDCFSSSVLWWAGESDWLCLLTPPLSVGLWLADLSTRGRWSGCQWTKRLSSFPPSPPPSAYQSSHSWLSHTPFTQKMASIRTAMVSPPLPPPLSQLSESQRSGTLWASASRGWPSAGAAPTVTANQSPFCPVTSCWVGTSLTHWTSIRSWTKTSTSESPCLID